MVVQSARIADFRGNSFSRRLSTNKSNPNAIILPINIVSYHWQNATAPPDCLLIEQVCNDRAGM